MSNVGGFVGADGESNVPNGIVDMASMGEDLTLDQELEEKLHELWKSAAQYTELEAKYKLEIMFTEDRSMHRPFGGFIFAMSNGGFAHGGGDEAIYLCTAKVDKDGQTKTCNNPLDLKWIGKDKAICPKCRNIVNPRDLCGQVYAKLPMQKWATLITRFFQVLDCNADIRIGSLSGDLRRTTAKEMEKSAHGDKINALRLGRSWSIYPLANIIKDTAAGADLYGRIRAFLNA